MRRDSSHRREYDDSPLRERGRSRREEGAKRGKEATTEAELDANLVAELESVAVSPGEKKRRAGDGDLAARVKERLRQSLEKKREEARHVSADVSAGPAAAAAPPVPEALQRPALGAPGPEALTPAGPPPGLQGPFSPTLLPPHLQTPAAPMGTAGFAGGVQAGFQPGLRADGGGVSGRGAVLWEGPLCKSGAPYCRVAMVAENVPGCRYEGSVHEPAG